MRNIYKKVISMSLLLMLMILTAETFAISVNTITKGNLSSFLMESSALDYAGNSTFWSLNDSGNSNEIFSIANDGSLLKTITVSNAINSDWEEMTHDFARNYMFIGDFGNNLHNRTNLRIYRLPYPSGISSNAVTAEEIRFTYPDQTSFPSSWMNFDAEAFFHFQGQLYIFSKANGSAIGYTKMYSLPDVPGTYTATLVDSFYTGDRITSADISPDGSSVILLSYMQMHLFRNFTGADFFRGQHTLLAIAGNWTQKESVSFSSNNEIYITDENTGTGNQLYSVDLSLMIPSTVNNPTSINKFNVLPTVTTYPLPANEFVNIQFKDVSSGNVSFSLYDLTGKTVYSTHVDNPLVPLAIRTNEFPAGIYFYKVFADLKEIKTARLIISH